MRAQVRRISSTLPEFGRVTKNGFSDPAALDLDTVLGAIGPHNVAHAIQPYLIPISIEAKMSERLWVAASGHIESCGVQEAQLWSLGADRQICRRMDAQCRTL